MYDVEIDATDDITEDEIESLSMLYTTPQGTIPMERYKGIDMSYIDMPENVAQNMYALEVIKKTKKYSNNIEVSEVDFISNNNGNITAKVVIKRGE